MSAISNSLLDAINTISTNAVKASNATLTIECTITEVEDAGLQIYKVNYKDNIFSATSSSGSYNVGDIVYVLVPEGDFSKPKMILGAVVPSSANLVEEEVTDDYIEISENLFGNIGDVELCSYKLTPHDTPVADIGNFKDSILNYLNDGHRDFVFSMQIKTNLDLEQQRIGNYGIWLHLPVVVDDGHGGEEHTEQILNMDVSSILGNPYRLNNFTYQEIRYTFPDNVKQDNSEDAKELLLEKFAINFPLQDDNKDSDIFIKDISFKAVDALTAEHKEGYYLSLVCKDGNYFVENSGDKIIEPVLKLNGKSSKINTDDQDCYWFIEDSSINSSSPEYTYIAKNGQRCLNDLNLETSQYVTNVLSYTVKKESVIAEVKYRCSLVNVSKQIQKDAYITLSNKNKVIECFLTTVDNINTYPKDMGNVNLIATVEGIKSSDRIDLAWRRLDIDTEKELDSNVITIQSTSYTSIPNTDIGNWEGKASMPVSAISSQANKIICTFYISNKDKYGVVTQKILGTKEIIVQTTAEMVQHIAVQNGDVLYKYDGNGNSPMVADYAYPYQAKKTIPDITFKVYKNDGTELNEDEYNYCDIKQLIPKNSMIIQGKDAKKDQILKGDYYEYNGKGIEFQSLSYNIENIQNPKKTDNYIILNVTFKEEKLSEEINIKFVKEGESGTNGSAYTGMITFNDKTYDEVDKDTEGNLRICRLQLIYVKDGDHKGQYYNSGYAGSKIVKAPSSLTFGVKVYCNGTDTEGEVIYETPIYDLFDSKITSPILEHGTGGTFSLKENPTFADNEGLCNIIRAEIKVGNPGVLYEEEEAGVIKENDYEIIYAYYPIELIIIEKSDYFNQEEDSYVPYIADGYSQVLYASDGTNPQFDSTNPFKLENKDSVINEFAKNYSFVQEATSNFTIGQSAEIPEKCKFTPKTKYNSGESLNYIKVGIVANDATRKAALNEEKIILETETIPNLNTKKQDLENLKNNLLIRLFQSISAFDGILVSKDMELFLSKRQSILNKIVEFKKFIDGYEKTLKTDYNKNITELNTLRKDLQDLGSCESYDDIKAKIATIKNLEMNGSKLSKKTKKQFNEYANKINELLQDFKSYSNKTENENNIQSYINLILLIKGLDIPSFDKDTYKNLNVYTNLISLKSTYSGMIARLVGPNDTTGQVDDYILVSTYTDIQNLMSQIQSIFKEIIEFKYEEITNNEIEKVDDELKYRQKELAEINRILKCFDEGYLNIYRPILMLYNRYELSNVIGQDGNKLYTGENDDYLLAPQIGAGRKEDDNSFTGLIMGIRNHSMEILEEIKKANQVGLFGYDRGESTLFINAEDGSAIFGKSGTGQIIIDPKTDKALLYSSIFFDKYKIDGKPDGYSSTNQTNNGMLIDLTTPEIRFGNGNFLVTADGHLTAKGGGSIAGQNITDNELYSNVTKGNGRITLDSSSTGKIYSHSHSSLDNTTKGFYLSSNGLSIGSKLKINDDGEIYAKYIEASTGGIIGGQDISTSELSKGKMHIHTSNIYCGNSTSDYDQKITSNGDAYFNNIHCNNVFSIGNKDDGNYQSSSGSGTVSNFSFGGGSGGQGSISNDSFGFAGDGGSFSNTEFKGKGNASYGSNNPNPFSGECTVQIKSLAVDSIDANVINTKIAHADLTTSGSITCGTISVTSSIGSTINGRITFTGDNQSIIIGGYKLDGSTATITSGGNSYRVFLAKDI